MWEINEEMQKSCFWGIFLNCGEKKKYLNQMSMMDLGKREIVEENLIIEYKP